MKKIFYSFGPAFLILALGVGSGEFILWPFLTANYGFGILWGALLGISIQLLLINLISRSTLIFKESILWSFSKIFPWAIFWILFSTLVGFGWPGFATLSSELLVDGLKLPTSLFLPISLSLLLTSGLILIFAPSAYKRILFLEKIAMSLLFLLTIFLFVFYFDLKEIEEMFLGFLALGNNYLFIPKEVTAGFLATFLAAIAYAGSGGNLLLANSLYLKEEEKENKDMDVSLEEKIKNNSRQNFFFFWGGGILIIAMLAYISKVVLAGAENLSDDFSFLIKEAEIFSKDISPFIGNSFVILGAVAIFGVQIGIFDFLGRLTKAVKNHSERWKNGISDHKVYSLAVSIIMLFGLIILLAGFDKPKFLITTGAVINAFSMGVISLFLLLLERKFIPEKFKRKKNLIFLFLVTLFYFLFFLYVIWVKVF